MRLDTIHRTTEPDSSTAIPAPECPALRQAEAPADERGDARWAAEAPAQGAETAAAEVASLQARLAASEHHARNLQVSDAASQTDCSFRAPRFNTISLAMGFMGRRYLASAIMSRRPFRTDSQHVGQLVRRNSIHLSPAGF